MNFDIQIFNFFNSLSGVSQFWDAVFAYLAANLLWIMWLIFVVFLMVSFDNVSDAKTDKRLARRLGELKVIDYKLMAIAFISSATGFLINQLVGFFYFRPRPFLSLPANVLLNTATQTKSFPSDHTTLAFALAFSLFVFDKRWGTFFIVLALLQGLSRVVAGVHYLSDIIGGIIVAALVTFLAWLVVRVLTQAKVAKQ
jgi:membrane-associated phospholipid phosphatase